MNIEDRLIKGNFYIKIPINTSDEISIKNIETAHKNKHLGLLEFEMEQFNEEISLIYNIKGLKTLNDYLLDPLSRDKAYCILKNIHSTFSMMKIVLDKGLVCTETNYVFIKEINEVPYVYFLYIPLNTEFKENEEDIRKLIMNVIISIEDNDLRNEALSLYNGKADLESVINILKSDGIKYTMPNNHEDIEVYIKEVKADKEDELEVTEEVSEEDMNLIDDYEETTLIDEDIPYSSNLIGKLLINNKGVFTEKIINKDVTVIGRSINCDLVIPSKVISKKHACIFKMGRSLYIRDEGSKNGTFVNDKLLNENEKIRLKNKDIIKFGNVKCRFEI